MQRLALSWSRPCNPGGDILSQKGLLVVGVGVGLGVGFRARRGDRRGVRFLFGIAEILADARLNGAGRGAGHGSILSACRADRLADQPREEGGEEVERHP